MDISRRYILTSKYKLFDEILKGESMSPRKGYLLFLSV